MWHAKYSGPYESVVRDFPAATWREAHSAAVGMLRTVQPTGTYITLFRALQDDAKPDQEWSTTDATHTFSLTQAHTRTDDQNVDALICLHCGMDVEHPVFEGCTRGDCPLPANYHRPTIGDAVDMMTDTGLDAETVLALLLDEPLAEIDHTAREHSELGGSIAERWMNCPASVRLVRGQPNPTSTAAERGTAAHEVALLCLLSGQDAVEFIGRIVNDIEVDEQIADGVQEYLDDCRACPADEVEYEVRFNLESLKPPVPMFGTADYKGYHRATQTLYIKDYKNGFMYVDPRTPQGRYYASGGMRSLRDDQPVSRIIVTICQPNALGATLKTDTFDAVELIEWEQDLIAAAHRTQDPDAPAVAGPWCDKTFCPVRASCSARAAHSLAAAQVEFADYISPMRTPEVRLLSAAERGAIHGAADGLRAFLSAIEESIKADTSGTGWKLVPTETRQAWRNKDDAAVTLRMDHGINPYEPAEVISPAVARGKLKESLHAYRVSQHATGKKPTKNAAEDDARKLLAYLITDISSGTKLVPEADSRPAIPTGGAEFDKVTQ